MKKYRFLRILAGVGAVLLIPLAAMQFTTEVNWSVRDFGVMAILLTGIFTGIDGVLRIVDRRKYQVFGVGVVILLGLLIWIELAVGLFGTPFAGS